MTALLFVIGKFAVGLYLGKSDVASSFGTAGSLAVLLVWVYYSAQIFLLGAEFTWVYAHRFGSQLGKDRPATAKESVATTTEPHGHAAVAGREASAHARPAPAAALPEAPPAVLGAVRRHPAVTMGGALLLGALAGELLNLYRKRATK